MNNWRKILYPFSLLYGSAAAIRNIAFDRKILFSKSYTIPVIAIGNLSTGGTGKTPMTEYLIELLCQEYKLGIVSRGYGRKTKGLLEATSEHESIDIGDESLKILAKYSDVKLAVAEKRKEGIDYLLNKYPDLQIILLDDAFQHRYVKASFHILLTTFQEPFYKDLVLPAGNLREFSSGKKRADLIVITKTPSSIDHETALKIEKKIGHPHVLFSSLGYSELISVSSERQEVHKKVIVATGIAQPKLMLNHISKSHQILKHFSYPDHYNFSQKEIGNWLNYIKLRSDVSVITTEKDWARLKNRLPEKLTKKSFLLPVKTEFLFDGNQKIARAIESLYNKRH